VTRHTLLACILLACGFPAALLAAPDGASDTDFGGDGLVNWSNAGKVTVHDVAMTEAVVIGVGSYVADLGAQDPRVHWQGFDQDGSALVLKACYLPAGTLVPFAVASQGLAALVDSSGNLLVGGTITFQGTESQQRALLQRFDLSAVTCTLDDTFSSNGWDVEDDESWCDTEDCAVVALAEIRRETFAVTAPRIVALVRSTVSSSVARYFLLAFHLNGAIDNAFGSNGWAEVTNDSLSSLGTPAEMAVDGLGRIYVMVTDHDEGTADLDVHLLRFSADGELDDSSWRIADNNNPALDLYDERAEDLAFTSSGPVVTAHDPGAGNVVQELDLASGYLLDSTHSSSAWLSTSLAVQGNGRYLEAHDLSTASDAIRLRRRLDGAAPDSYDDHFGSAGSVTIDIDLGGDHAQKLARLRLWHGRPIVAGTAIADDGDPAGFIWRGLNSYVFGDGFDGGSESEWSYAPIAHPVVP
jgi:hypothetical protein